MVKLKILLSLILLFFLAAALSCQSSETPDTGAGGREMQLTSQDCQLVPGSFGQPGQIAIRVEKVVIGLEVPWSIGFLPNGGMLISERPGRVRLFRNNLLVDAPVLNLQVGGHGEGGLLGLALHPDFSNNRFFYIYYSLLKSGAKVNRVQRFKLSDDETSATPDKILLDDIPWGTFHDGGRLRFGPDGMLYIGTGDARVASRSQNFESLAGKILRLTPDGEIPSDNPTSGSPVFISGIRNTQGFDWYRRNALIVTDHGPSGELGRRGADEISLAYPGANLGWPITWKCENKDGLVSPLITWENALPPGGAALYTGTEISEWRGSLLIGTLGSQHLHRVVLQENAGVLSVAQHEVYLAGAHGYGRLREVIMGPDGQLYVTTSNCDGNTTCGPEKDLVLRIRK